VAAPNITRGYPDARLDMRLVTKPIEGGVKDIQMVV
jgi:hypothetical protein